ncbi:hypothetical protein FGO68_gene13079 [Halteria grandinella]|uniref:Uncharacterized protein n=1 Tax=Halteria grandinella TaxID=5974 RepID=A0A8J8T4J0_HALGN|nr:hypothetical protein FGO68_gene13079 [Halteria grandinella]
MYKLIMNILSQQPQDALQPSDYIHPNKETLVVIYRNFRVAYQALIKQTMNKHIFSKEIQCPDCGSEYLQ